ncbi:dienelactone hydrolase family protein [Dyella mobilis]|uniref:Prolyl oligopeptidase family serine peptidase n=1 Tax=Dyella mobilis TaxID=1849582 RepID=A0ABS2KDH3_9GAMM|nr:CocE/NonD family hydrolase [Dyella mobilis]MBM7129232.1 prolyl oligopeptidase family serine peptidase [Dyella mobilis]
MTLLLLATAQFACADDATDAEKAPDAALLHERVVRIPSNQDNPVTLVMTIFTPDGPGPFPLAVMNHGSTGDVPAAQQPRYRLSFSNYYFLSRGYAVAIPMMRGYAGSEGRLTSHGCNDLAMGIDNAKDIRAAIDYMKQQSYVDGSRILVAGQSFGGWNALAVGALKVPGVKALVSFAGGMKASDCRDPDHALIEAAGELGEEVSTPSIWFFGDNDEVFATPVWRAMYEHYVASGAPAELVAYGTFGTNSHNLLGSGEGLSLWVPKLDDFLGRNGLPNKLLNPQYMPQTPPPPSHYADLTDLEALPYLGGIPSGKGVAYYQKFLTRPLPRALAIGLHGAGEMSGGFDPMLWAMRHCQKVTMGCRLYAVDNEVVWTRTTPEPPPTHFAVLTDEHAVPYLNDKGRLGYEKFLMMNRPRAFAVAPDGGWTASTQGLDPVASALARCGSMHKDCRLYAVDGDVVWRP